MSRDIHMPLIIDEIIVGDGRRDLNTAQVSKLAKSIDEIGLRHPITVRKWDGKYYLIAGRHRLEACKKLGLEHIQAVIVSMTKDEARLWEIAENLHRAELTKLERDDHASEWIRLTEQFQSRQSDGNESKREDGRGHRPEGGIAAASRELGISEADARRAIKVASLSPEAKEAARATGLDNNRAALLAAASKPSVAEQVATVHQLHKAKVAPDELSDAEAQEAQVAALMSAWNKAGPGARDEFLLRIDRPIMDRNFA